MAAAATSPLKPVSAGGNPFGAPIITLTATSIGGMASPAPLPEHMFTPSLLASSPQVQLLVLAAPGARVHCSGLPCNHSHPC